MPFPTYQLQKYKENNQVVQLYKNCNIRLSMKVYMSMKNPAAKWKRVNELV